MTKTWVRLGAALLLTVGGFIWFVVNSQTGLSWTIQLLSRSLPDQFSVGSAEGRLLGPIKFSDLRFKSADLTLEVDRGSIDWQAAKLFHRTMQVNRLDAEGVTLLSKQTSSEQPTAQLSDIYLPLALDLKSIAIKGIHIDAGIKQDISEIHLAALAKHNQISVHALRIESRDFSVNTIAELTMRGDYPLQASLQWTAKPGQYAQVDGLATLSGTLSQLQVSHRFSGGIDAQLQATVKDIMTSPSWTADFSISRFETNKFYADWPELLLSAQLTSAGQAADFTFAGNITAQQTITGALDTRFEVRAKDQVLQMCLL